jgi:hypothetical protein
MTSPGPKIPFKLKDQIKWRNQLDADHGLPTGAAATGGVLVTFVNEETGTARPSFDTLAKRGGVVQSTVITRIKNLLERGHLGIERRGGRHLPNVYWPILHSQKTVASTPELPDQKLSRLTEKNSSVGATRTYLPDSVEKKPINWGEVSLQSPSFKQLPRHGEFRQREAKIETKLWDANGSPITSPSSAIPISEMLAALVRGEALTKVPTMTSSGFPAASPFLLAAMRPAATQTSSS